MPTLSEINYSRNTCITAVRDYRFLTKMYLEESDVIEPPEGGWPNITTDSLKGLGKTDEVIALLRSLPYICPKLLFTQGAPWCCFADWKSNCHHIHTLRLESGKDLGVVSEGDENYENVPSHVIGLTSGGRDNPIFLLDTKLGIVHWFECPREIRNHPSREPVLDDTYDWAPENEAGWRGEGVAWAIADFFRDSEGPVPGPTLCPISLRKVVDVWTKFGVGTDGMVAMVQDIFWSTVV